MLPPLDSGSHVASPPEPDGPVSPESIIAALQEQNAALSALVAALQARVAELEPSTGPEQWQQRQASVQRRSEEEAGPGEQPS
jgi:hypothetical protein